MISNMFYFFISYFFRTDVCLVQTTANVSLARAGATSEFVADKVLFCGGQNGQGHAHRDCLLYDPITDKWLEHSNMIRYEEIGGNLTAYHQDCLLYTSPSPRD